jgi:cyclopropane fatty-acyl-phospholipid synthase-like methyltransferase
MERDNMMHGARAALNTDPNIRAWAENFLKERSRGENTQMTDEEFENYWKYHKPEIMHAGAAEAIQAYKSNKD